MLYFLFVLADANRPQQFPTAIQLLRKKRPECGMDPLRASFEPYFVNDINNITRALWAVSRYTFVRHWTHEI